MSRKDDVAPVVKRRKLSHSSEQGLANGRFDRTPSDDELSGDGDSGEAQPEPRATPKTQKVSRRSSTNLANETAVAGLGMNSTLASQVRDLLRETTSNFETRSRRIVEITDRITKAINSLTKQGPYKATEAEKYTRDHGNVAVPYPSPRPTKESNLKYEYDSPSSITVRGPSASRLALKGPENVSVALEMPSSLIQDKDYLNLRAFHKRAFYLARVSVGLKDALGSDFVLQYEFLDGLELLPVLRITPAETSVKASSPSISYVVCIDLPLDAFDQEKTLPSKNCVRFGHQQTGSPPSPTPFYNSCLRSTTVQKYYHELMATTTRRCAGFLDACRLGQLWLAQRGYGTLLAHGGFGWWEWAVCCALLLQTGGPRGQPLFSDRYSSIQLFKAMLQVLATRDLTQPWLLRSDAVDIAPSNVPVLYDGKTGVNLLFKMQGASYQRLRNHAQVSLIMVNSKQDDSFDSTFIYRVAEPSLKYDEIYSCTINNDANAYGQNEVYGKLFSVLSRGLGDRTTLLDIKPSTTASWNIKASKPRSNNIQVQIRLSVNPDNVSRLVDHGPSAEEQDAAVEFQRFWGAKSELRRFKDGSITESLVWNSTEPVTLQIIQHLLKRHVSAEAVIDNPDQSRLEVLMLPAAAVSAKDTFALIYQKFQSLSSTLHSLTDLPLPIRSVSPASEALRSTTLTSPLTPSTAEPTSVLIQFDSSSRWPDSLPAIQHTKIAFLLKLGDALSNQDTSLTTRLGLEHTSTATSGHLNTAFLDVVYAAPAQSLAPLIFRLRIHHDRELHLLQNALADKSLHGATRDALASAMAVHKRDFLATPAHTTALRPLMTRFPALSPAIRLLKRWSSSHLLSRHIPNETLEIITAHIFVHPAPWATPGSATTAFLRCLWFLAKWDWAVTPLIVDLSLGQEMSADQRAQLRTRFEAWRKLDPNMNQVSWFVGTNTDESGVVWTGSGHVEKVVAGRVTALAAACMEVVSASQTGLADAAARSLLSSGLEEYDFLIYLEKKVVKGHSAKKHKGKYRNLEVAEETDVDAVGFDPVQEYLGDLEASFKSTALFFYGASGDGVNVIAGLWRPGVKGRREWKVRLGWSSVPIREKGGDEGGAKEMAEINKMGILKEIEIMGEGLVREVKVQE